MNESQYKWKWTPEEGFAHSLTESGPVYERFNLVDRRQEVKEQAGHWGLDLRLLQRSDHLLQTTFV